MKAQLYFDYLEDAIWSLMFLRAAEKGCLIQQLETADNLFAEKTGEYLKAL